MSSIESNTRSGGFMYCEIIIVLAVLLAILSIINVARITYNENFRLEVYNSFYILRSLQQEALYGYKSALMERGRYELLSDRYRVKTLSEKDKSFVFFSPTVKFGIGKTYERVYFLKDGRMHDARTITFNDLQTKQRATFVTAIQTGRITVDFYPY